MKLSHLLATVSRSSAGLRVGKRDLAGEFSQLSLFAFAVLNLSVSEPIQQAIRTFSDLPEPAMRAWNYMMTTFQAPRRTNQILLADKLSRFGQRPNEDLEEYINRGKALQGPAEWGRHTALRSIPVRIPSEGTHQRTRDHLRQDLHASAHPNGRAALVQTLTTAREEQERSTTGKGKPTTSPSPPRCRRDASQDPQGGSPESNHRLKDGQRSPFHLGRGHPRTGTVPCSICYQLQAIGAPLDNVPHQEVWLPADRQRQASSLSHQEDEDSTEGR